MLDAVVIGGGIAGLTTGFRLAQAGLDVRVLEADKAAGGHARSTSVGGFLLERGPHSFPGSAHALWQLIADLKMDDAVLAATPGSRNRYIVRDGRPQAIPLGPGSFVASRLLSPLGKIRLLTEPLIRSNAQPEGSVWQFFVRRFGWEAATYLLAPFVSGTYGGDARQLGARAAFPRFYALEANHGSMLKGALRTALQARRRTRREGGSPRRGTYSFRDGIGQLAHVLSGRLAQRLQTGVAVQTLQQDNSLGWQVLTDDAEHRCRTVVLALPPDRAAAVLGSVAAASAELLRLIPLSPIAVVYWAAALRRHPAPGFGLLVPPSESLRVLGTLFPSQLFSGRAPDGNELFASFYGGITDAAALDLKDRQLEALVKEEHARILGLPIERVRVLGVVRHRRAIPQLLPSHPEVIQQIESDLAAKPGLFLAGNYLTGVSVDHAVGSGITAASRTRAFLCGGRAS